MDASNLPSNLQDMISAMVTKGVEQAAAIQKQTGEEAKLSKDEARRLKIMSALYSKYEFVRITRRLSRQPVASTSLWVASDLMVTLLSTSQEVRSAAKHA